MWPLLYDPTCWSNHPTRGFRAHTLIGRLPPPNELIVFVRCACPQEMQLLQQAVSRGTVDEDTDVFGYLLSTGLVMKKYSADMAGASAETFFDFASTAAQAAITALPAFGPGWQDDFDLAYYSVLLAADLGTRTGWEDLRSVLSAAAGKTPRGIAGRVNVQPVHAGDVEIQGGVWPLGVKLMHVLLQAQAGGINTVDQLSQVTSAVLQAWGKGEMDEVDFEELKTALEAEGLAKLVSKDDWEGNMMDTVAVLTTTQRHIVSRGGASLSVGHVVLNGKQLEYEVGQLTTDDVEMWLQLEASKRGRTLRAMRSSTCHTNLQLVVASTLLGRLGAVQRTSFQFTGLRTDRVMYDSKQTSGSDDASDGHSNQQDSSSALKVVALLDPLSPSTQRVAPLLLFLRDTLGAEVSMVLNPQLEVEEQPLRSFFRFNLGHPDPSAPLMLEGIPVDHLLTLKVCTACRMRWQLP